ncbi:carbohydrate-binding protein [Actinomadura darangshiensis]|uniref:Carbohydrate-binding protein n=1 Tax=Actinomadura darangshiensis TaxID=705336 RepID=A0A4R5B3J9_9ACTN|nr:CBM35 domain-containing protein [Actinomadura darangshiensis]TDD80331.1 carbohydrate-binding protein [Actinomadura darangshiensis]
MTKPTRRFLRRTAIAGALTLTLPTLVAIAAEPAGASSTTVTVRADGGYTIDTSGPRYHFAGSVGVPVDDIKKAKGRDGVGTYHETGFDYSVGGVARTSAIRSYDRQRVVLFSTTYRKAAANAHPFPAFSARPALPHTETFSGCFANRQFDTSGDAGLSPYLAFGASGGGYLLSPASNFTTAVTKKDADGALTSGISSKIGNLPAGFTQRTVLAFGSGVNDVYDTWGHALTGLSGKHRPSQDATNTLAKLGYWTDNGATYYYKYDEDRGYAGTLKAVRDEWKSKGLPMGNLQLDSWFYPKGANAAWDDKDGGEYRYEADRTLFPDGLKAFQRSVGVPLITHARWIDPSSPYHQEYKTSGQVVTDPAFWNDRMRYLKANGVDTFEQDWLCSHAQPEFNLNDRAAFLGNMAKAAAANGLDVQYCMPLPQDFLQSTLYDNVTNTRVSNDRFERSKWDEFLYASRLASALGMWPWADVAMSTETENLLLQNLSGGLVGVGDPIGEESAENLKKVAEADGTIVKPDTPIVPNDATYVNDAADPGRAMVATTGSRHGPLSAGYVFSYARDIPMPPPDTTYEAEDATLSGPVVATDHKGYTGSGFADFRHDSGDYVQWDVDVPSDGTYTLLFRYANAIGDRPLAVAVDGGAATTQPFASTGNWDAWSAQPVVLNLSAGRHTVRASATGANGPNIDNLGVSAGKVTVPTTTDAQFRPDGLGVTGKAYVYDYFAGTGTLVDGNAPYTAQVTRSGSYFQVVPVGRSGIAFLGDAGKFVSLGKQRIRSLSDNGSVHATVAFASGDDPVTLHGYSPTPVTAHAAGATVDHVTYDNTTHLFSARVNPGHAHTAAINLTRR